MDISQLDQHRSERPEHACGVNPVREIIDRYGGEPDMLIPMMQDIQGAEGYLPREHLNLLARELGVPLSRVYGVATFYASFRLQPKGEHTVTLCMGTVCYLKGADQIKMALEEEFQAPPGGTSPDGKFTFAPVNCLGACALAPVMVVDGEYFGGVTPTSAVNILQRIAAGKRPSAGDGEPVEGQGEASEDAVNTGDHSPHGRGIEKR
jgi:NADH:ubiquinone oxidoreductase subunit E